MAFRTLVNHGGVCTRVRGGTRKKLHISLCLTVRVLVFSRTDALFQTCGEVLLVAGEKNRARHGGGGL